MMILPKAVRRLLDDSPAGLHFCFIVFFFLFTKHSFGQTPPPPVALPASQVSANGFEANWGVVSVANQYTLELSEEPLFIEPDYFDVGNETSVLIEGLLAGTFYYYRVRAIQNGVFSIYSNVVTVLTLPDAPEVQAASSVSSNSFVANWTEVSTATQYYLDVSIENDFSSFILEGIATTQNNFFVSGLTPGQTYFYRVKAENASGFSGYSNTGSVLLPSTSSNAPAAPSALSALAVSSTSIRLSWRDNAINETGFEIGRSLTLVGGYESIAILAPNTGNTTTVVYIDEGLSQGTTYFYRVRTLGELANSLFSTPVSATTPADVPNAPGNLQGFALSDTEVYLTWEDNSDDETSFAIFRSTVLLPNTFAQIGTVGPDLTEFFDNTVQADVLYYYTVVALKEGVASGPSNLIGVFTAPVPSPPRNLVASLVEPYAIEIIWNDESDNEDGFGVEISEIGTSNLFVFLIDTPANVNTIRVDESLWSVEPNQRYQFRVFAYNSFGFSAYSNVLTANTIIDPTVELPEAPSNMVAEPVSTQEVALRWSDNDDNESSFSIERSPAVLSSNGEIILSSFVEIDRVLAGTTNYNDLGVAANTLYAYRVRALNGGGRSLPSDTALVETVCNIVSVIETDIDGNGSIACGSKQILLDLQTNVTAGAFQWFKMMPSS
ncbi:MAG: fibronectin type III domain-containing protein [Microscillaceae bacterium]|nr:fibronectin type III domain-containing protein [Microscillaceae bacterium]